MEVGDLLRRLSSVAFAIPRQLANIADAGSRENALEQIKDSASRRRIEAALQEGNAPRQPEPTEAPPGQKVALK